MKIKIFTASNYLSDEDAARKFEIDINEFIKYKDIKDIKPIFNNSGYLKQIMVIYL